MILCIMQPFTIQHSTFLRQHEMILRKRCSYLYAISKKYKHKDLEVVDKLVFILTALH